MPSGDRHERPRLAPGGPPRQVSGGGETEPERLQGWGRVEFYIEGTVEQ